MVGSMWRALVLFSASLKGAHAGSMEIGADAIVNVYAGGSIVVQGGPPESHTPPSGPPPFAPPSAPSPLPQCLFGDKDSGSVTTLDTHASNDIGTLKAYAMTMTPDGANLLVADMTEHSIRSVSYPRGLVTTLAGQGNAGVSGNADGTGTSATFNMPRGIAINPNGDTVIIADTNNHRLRMMTYPGGVVTTFAGSSYAGQDNDEPTGQGQRRSFQLRMALHSHRMARHSSCATRRLPKSDGSRSPKALSQRSLEVGRSATWMERDCRRASLAPRT